MADEKYYKIRGSILADIADAIRMQKKSDATYHPEDFARIIKAMAVIPASPAKTTLVSGGFSGLAVGVLPTVYTGVAVSILERGAFESYATGELTEQGG